MIKLIMRRQKLFSSLKIEDVPEGEDFFVYQAFLQELLHNVVKLLEAIIIIRVLRIAVYLDEIKTFRIIMETMKSLLTPFWSMLSVMFSIFYIYSVIGIAVFGGIVDFDSEAIRNNDSTPDIWALNNFNDFTNAYLVLFELTIVNNWQMTAEMFVALMDTRWVLLYFVSFYIIAVLVGMNILVCFAIDMYQSICRLDNEQTVHE
jgi:two pore calcium channel protein, plant